MTEQPSTSTTVPASASFGVRYLQPGKSSVMLYLPELYHGPIGLIVAYWGNFEVVFDSCLDALIAAEVADGNTRETSGWRVQGFKKRRRLCTKICAEWLAGWRPDEAQTISRLLSVAADLHWRRNLIAHGIYGYTVPAMSSVATNCCAINHSTGEKLPFDEDVLKRLYHSISHLTADLIMAFKRLGQFDGPFLLLSDAEIIRHYNDTVHPWNPDRSKRPTTG